MGAVAGPASGERLVRLLDYDPTLADTLRPERRAEARATAEATTIQVGRGPRTRLEIAGGRRSPYGVLLLDGLVNRALLLDGVVSAQLLGRGDLVRVEDEDEALVATATRWTVLQPLSVALLDERFLLSVRRWPEIVAALFGRLAAQEQRREVHRALLQLPRVEDRVHALLWLLAERWGRMTPHGVLLRLRLTHELIGQLVGAKRPTVSLALKQLEQQGSVHRRPEGGWLLGQGWSAQPTAEPALACDGAQLTTDGATATHAGASLRSRPSVAEDVHRRIERMRRLHARTRQDVAEALARSAAARERSLTLRDRPARY